MQWLAAQCPETETIVLVQDNLNAHNPGSCYQAFVPDLVLALAQLGFPLCRA